MTQHSHGIILVTGPTGSGKTTTLYSSLKQLATEQVNVCTIEDPIEMLEPSFNQMQVNHGIDLGFADGVRALMRQDPDYYGWRNPRSGYRQYGDSGSFNRTFGTLNPAYQ